MTTQSTKALGFLGSVVFAPFSKRFLSLIGRTLFAAVLISLIWLPGLSSSALAVPTVTAATNAETLVAQTVVTAEGDRTSALITCLPKQLSQPNLQRALGEMGNDQVERIFSLKSDLKLSQAETELKDCLSRKGFIS
jgi:hypothetical protein